MPDSDQLTKLIHQVAVLRRQIANMIRPATVHEVKGDKLRMVIGKGIDGEDILGPWLDTVNHRGGARERRFYKKGQNLTLLSPNGDLSQAMVAPFAPNKNHKTPDHANDTGQDEEVYQLDDLRVKKTKDGYSIWLQKPEQNEQQQQPTDDHQNEKPQKRQQQKPDARIALRIHNDGGITARIGKDKRFMVNKDGVKMKAGGDFAIVQSGKLICSREWEIGKDSVKDDDDI